MTGGQDYDDADGTSAVPDAGRAPGGRAGWIVLVVALAAAGVWGALRFSGPSAAYAAGPGKPVMLMFTADWCGPCQALKAGMLSHPVVLDRLEQACRFHTVDLTEWSGPSAATAKHYGVAGVPTLILVDGRGREISRYQGPRDPQSFTRWIDQYTR